MDSTSEASFENVEKARKELLSILASKDPTFTAIEQGLVRYRTACENFILLDYGAAFSKKTEDELWEIHGRVNRRFRTHFARFRDGDGKRRHVERRKLEKYFVDFIKSSMRYYRGYIQRLASQFAAIPEIMNIARMFSLDTSSVEPRIMPDSSIQQQLLQSCHAALNHLGDLSRYRETEMRTHDRNWGPAKGYYNLAIALRPDSGVPFNALAVMALADEDHFRTLYYLYRAVVVAESNPATRNNLELEFAKVLGREAKHQVVVLMHGDPGLVALQTQFIIFHSKCYKGDHFDGYEDVENDILSQISVYIRERQLDGFLNKVCLINIAAEYNARQHHTASERTTLPTLHPVALFQRFNIKTFFMLLQVFLSELERVTINEARPDPQTQERLTTVARRVLPCLRHYSSWLLGDIQWLNKHGDETLTVQIEQFWRLYAQTLTLIMSSFQIRELPEIYYLLAEDEDTLGFMPLMKAEVSERYYFSAGRPRPSTSAAGVIRQSPIEELHFRIKGLVKDGLKLVRRGREELLGLVPISFAQQSFIYEEAGLPLQPAQSQTSGSSHSHNLSSSSISRHDIESARDAVSRGFPPRRAERDDISEPAESSSHLSTTMRDMVDDLVDSETSEHPGSAEPNEGDSRTPTLRKVLRVPGDDPTEECHSALTAKDLVRQMQRPTNAKTPDHDSEPPMLPALSSIWTPRPGEASTPRPGTAHRTTPSGSAPRLRSSAAEFQEAIAQQQQPLQMRSSPQQSLQPSTWSEYETPTAKTSMLRTGLDVQRPPWHPSSSLQGSGSASAYSQPFTDHGRYGAIGQMPPQGRTPTSGQGE